MENKEKKELVETTKESFTGASNEFNLEKIISTSIQVPGVKVDRKKFLAETFSGKPTLLQDIWESGPIKAGLSREELNKIAYRLIVTRTSESSAASFLAGIPGGLAMAATIPADMLQFFGMTLRLAQELAYLYGAEDLWQNGKIDDERVRNQLIVYCGVMFGVSGASAGLRLLSKQVAKQAMKTIPQKALTKTFWYPIVKQIGKSIGLKITKTTVANGISKAIPVVGGVISGGLNFASMLPMAKRLQITLDEAAFGEYTEAQVNADVEILEHMDEDARTNTTSIDIKEKMSKGIKNVGTGISGFIHKHIPQGGNNNQVEAAGVESDDEIFTKIEKLSKLKEMGAITEEEFTAKKTELLERL